VAKDSGLLDLRWVRGCGRVERRDRLSILFREFRMVVGRRDEMLLVAWWRTWGEM
jgi:hypothetical protein